MDRSGKGRWGDWRVEILDPAASFLHGAAGNEYSQFGEDGILAALFARIGETNRWCFEVGAADGLFCSNTKRLRDAGWKALLIEADEKHFAELMTHASEKVQCVRHLIAGDDLDRLLARAGAPADLDFGVIDIDGQDWHILKALTVYRPRVLLVEHSGHASSAVPPQGSAHGQAGLQEIVDLGREKGYVALAKTAVNVIFCSREAWDARMPGEF